MASTRRLAAILAADVAGYSRLMGQDEEGTHERLKAHLRELVDPNSENDAFVLRVIGVAVDHRALDLDGTTHRIHNGRKLHQDAVAGDFDVRPRYSLSFGSTT